MTLPPYVYNHFVDFIEFMKTCLCTKSCFIYHPLNHCLTAQNIKLVLQSLWKEVYVSLISRLCNTRDEGGSIIFMKFAGKRGSILKLTNGLVTSFNKKLMHHLFQYNETDKDKVCYCYTQVFKMLKGKYAAIKSFTWNLHIYGLFWPIVWLIYDHGLDFPKRCTPSALL